MGEMGRWPDADVGRSSLGLTESEERSRDRVAGAKAKTSFLAVGRGTWDMGPWVGAGGGGGIPRDHPHP